MKTTSTQRTTREVAARFHELAQQNKWFEIQDELFAEHVRSIEPPSATRLPTAAGKAAVRKKAESWVARIQALHSIHATEPIVAGDHFSIGQSMDITVEGYGRIQMNELNVYEVQDGQIVLEQFFYAGG
jgi:hypothetical protein